MSNSDLRRAWKAQQAQKQDVTNAIPALMGNGHGVVEVPNQPGYVYIRLGQGDLGQAYNNRCPLADNLAIYVGYDPVLDPDRRIFQVLSVRMADYAGAGGTPTPNVPPHHLTHEYGGGDDVYVSWRRLMGFRVGRPSGFQVTVDEGVIIRAGAWLSVLAQTIDLTALKPVGNLGCYVLIVLNAAGVVTATAGASVAIGTLDISDCPIPGASEIPLAAVRLYGAQTAIGDVPTAPDIIDLRFPQSTSTGDVHLEDLSDYARGHIIRGGAADWESYHAANSGFIVQGDGTDVKSLQFDWDAFSAGAGADMVHNHLSDSEGGLLASSSTQPALFLTDDFFAGTSIYIMTLDDGATTTVIAYAIAAGDVGEWDDYIGDVNNINSGFWTLHLRLSGIVGGDVGQYATVIAELYQRDILGDTIIGAPVGSNFVGAIPEQIYDFTGIVPAPLMFPAPDQLVLKISVTVSDGSVFGTINFHVGDSTQSRLTLPTSSIGGGGLLTVAEADGSPSVGAVQTIHVGNGDLTDEGGGAVRILTASDIAESVVNYSEQDISNPPTYDDIVTAFGLPNPGLVGIINDDADDSHVYICGATIMGWWYADLAKAAELVATMLSVITTDTMTDGAGTHLNVHTPDVGGAWTENSGSWTIQAGGDVRQATAAGAYYIATQDIGKDDFQARTLIGTVDAAGVTFGGVIFRYSDASNFWVAGVTNDASPLVILRKVVAGVPTDITKAWVAKHQLWVAIEVTCDGNDITAIFDGGFTLTTTDAFNNTATKVGIFEYRDVTYKAHGFDDFQVIDLPAYPWTRIGTVVDETEAWESGGTLEPSVIYDTDPRILTGDYVWKMWYSGSWITPGVGYAESPDGTTWTKYASNPIATDPRHCHVFKVGNTYYMYGSDGSVSRTRVNLWTSTDGLTWTLDTTACISVGAGAAWDSKILGNTFVWRESSTAWYMLYDATDTLVGGIAMTFRLGLATSTDGRTWVKSPANPVIDYAWQEAGSPWVTKSDDGYYYLFGLGSTYGFAPTVLWRWRSNNLTTWERLPYFTIIPRVGVTEGEDTYDGQTADPFIVERDGTAYMYFTGVQDAYTGGSRIVLATADARAIRGY